MSIYVVDDHPMMRDAIAMVMRRLHPHRNVVELGCLAELMPSVDAAGQKTAGASELVAALRNLLFDIPLSNLRVARDQGRHQIALIAEAMDPHGCRPASC
jgi:DNA-binding NarL/FixJ family response regulator